MRQHGIASGVYASRLVELRLRVDSVLQHAPDFRKDLVMFRGPHAHARGYRRNPVPPRTARSSVVFDRAGQNRIIPKLCPNGSHAESILQPKCFILSHFDSESGHNFWWMGGLMDCRDGSYSAFPHALLVTLVAQRPFRICSATRWIIKISYTGVIIGAPRSGAPVWDKSEAPRTGPL